MRRIPHGSPSPHPVPYGFCRKHVLAQTHRHKSPVTCYDGIDSLTSFPDDVDYVTGGRNECEMFWMCTLTPPFTLYPVTHTTSGPPALTCGVYQGPKRDLSRLGTPATPSCVTPETDVTSGLIHITPAFYHAQPPGATGLFWDYATGCVRHTVAASPPPRSMGILPMSRRAILALSSRALAPVRLMGRMPMLR
jgi:hypothetical protein